MKLKAVSGIMLTLLFVSMLTLVFNIQPVKTSFLSGDFDEDYDVDFWDILYFVDAYREYGKTGVVDPNCDFDMDADIDFWDVLAFVDCYRNWKISLGWKHWEYGNIPQAEKVAEHIFEQDPFNNEALHLKAATSTVQGNYSEAIDLYSKIDPSYDKYANVTRMIADIYTFHQVELGKAHQLLESINDPFAVIVEKRILQPYSCDANDTYIIPFLEDVMYAEYMPAISGKINGDDAVLRLDTGGSYLYMGPNDAGELGISLTYWRGFGYRKDVEECWYGIADELILGEELVFRNVPVIALEMLENFPIFGTTILESFLCTIDYPNSRFILTSRSREDLYEEHMDMITGEKVNMTFYMWGSHLMLAKGHFADNYNLTFLVDSGLLAVNPAEKQASFMASKESMIRYGFNESELNVARFFQTLYSLGLGELVQADTLVYYNPNTWEEDWYFGGILIHGIISHAFLSKYSWTIDFDKNEYIFGVN